jgi:hypothetical protein
MADEEVKGMVRMRKAGIRVEVPESQVNFMIRAGYSINEEPPEPTAKRVPSAPAEPVVPTMPPDWEPEEEPVEEEVVKPTPKKRGKK